MPLRYFVAHFVLFFGFFAFVWGPLVLGMGVDWLSSAYPGWRGARQVLWMFFVWITGSVSIGITWLVLEKIADAALDNDTVLMLYVLADVLLAAATYCLAGRRHRCFSTKASPKDGNHGLSVTATAAEVGGAGGLVCGTVMEPVDGSQPYHPTGLVQPEEDGTQPIEATDSSSEFPRSHKSV